MVLLLVIFLLLLRFFNKMENQTKNIKLEILLKKKVDSLLKITFDFMIRKCKRSYDEKTDQVLDIKWHETSLFCLAFEIKVKLFTDCFYWSMCTCKPFKCERFCFNVDYEKIPYKVGKEWDHCINLTVTDVHLEIKYRKFQVNYYRIQTIYIKYIIALTSYLYCYMHMLALAEENI